MWEQNRKAGNFSTLDKGTGVIDKMYMAELHLAVLNPRGTQMQTKLLLMSQVTHAMCDKS